MAAAHTQYYVILDAGSSGTRVYVYEWKGAAAQVAAEAKEAALKAEEASEEAMKAEEAEEASEEMKRNVAAARSRVREALATSTAANMADRAMKTAMAAGRAEAEAAVATVVPKATIATGWKTMKTKEGLHKLAPELKDKADLAGAVHLSAQIEIYETITAITAATTEKVKMELKPLFDHARKFLETKGKGVDTTPLFLLATGGMRRLKQQNYEAFSILKNAIISYMNGSGFKDPKFDTITGDDEGLYGWIAANSADNRFRDNMLPHGFMEMGGESAQIAVSLTPTQYHEYKGLLRGVRLGGRNYVVFAKTWPGLGVESAWRRHEAKLRECGSALAYDPCLPNQFAYRLRGSDKIVTGTGDFRECLKETITLLGCPHKTCADGQLCIYANAQGDRAGCLLKDPLTGHTLMKFNLNQFLGASVYARATYGVFAELDPTKLAGNANSFDVFWEQVTTLAGKNWEQLKADRPEEDHKYLHKAFFMAGMIMSTLFFGFGIAMPAEAALVGGKLAEERARRALREALIAERRAKAEAAALDEELTIQREQHTRESENANQAYSDAEAARLGVPAITAPTDEDKTALVQSAGGMILKDELGYSHAIVMKKLAERVNKLHDAEKAVKVADTRRRKAIAEIDAIDAQLAETRPGVLAARDAVNTARIEPETHSSPDRLQHELYQAIKNADWTLGYVVLQASSTPRVLSLSEQSWSRAQFVPHNTDTN